MYFSNLFIRIYFTTKGFEEKYFIDLESRIKLSNNINKKQRYHKHNYKLDAENNLLQLEKNLKEKENKYYIPICRENGCDGHLKISIDEEKFLADCICDKNKDHKFNDLFLEIFESLYLKENFVQKCFSCSNCLENKDKYKCIECENVYC